MSVINPATNTVTATIPVGITPDGIAVNPTGTDVYVANLHSNTLSVINPTSNTVTNTIPVGNLPADVAVSPTGPEVGDVYVTNGGDNTVSVIS